MSLRAPIDPQNSYEYAFQTGFPLLVCFLITFPFIGFVKELNRALEDGANTEVVFAVCAVAFFLMVYFIMGFVTVSSAIRFKEFLNFKNQNKKK